MDKIIPETNACKRQVTTRKVLGIKGSLYICLPKLFCCHHDIKAGDIMALMMGENLKIMPFEKGN